MNASDITIFIPTYNRSEYLDDCLASIISEIREYDIPILISDNASTDDTKNIIERYQNEYQNITYIKQQDRIELDRNQLAFIGRIDTHYCLMIADDDTLISGGIATILKYLNSEYDYDLLLLNAQHYSEDLKEPKHNNMELERDINILNPILFMQKYFFYMHFSTLIINMDHLVSMSYDKYVGTYHAYCGIVFEYMEKIYLSKDVVNIQIIAEPIIIIRDGIKTYSSEKNEVYYNRFPSLFAQLPEIYQDTSKTLLRELLDSYSTIRFLVTVRISGNSNWLSHQKYHYLNNEQKAKHFIVNIIPIKILVMGKWLFKKARLIKVAIASK